MTTVAGLLAAVLQPSAGWQQYILQHWPTIAGTLSCRARIERIRGNTVILGVYDPHWMHELHFLSSHICQKINTHLDQPHVKDVRCILARPPRQMARSASQPIRTVAPVPPVYKRTLTSQEQSALGTVHDEQLQNIIRELLETI